MKIVRFVPALALVALSACDAGITKPDLPAPPPSFAKSAACAPANAVVTDEAGLNAALGAAQPGDVIGIDGTIVVSGPVVITSPGVTITCAIPGSGLQAGVDEYIFEVYAENVTIAHLDLDASGGAGAAYAVSDDLGYDGDGLHFVGNTVSCGKDCVFLPRVQDVVVADNHFTASVWGTTGVHLQNDATGAAVTGNTLVARVPRGSRVFGAIRVRDGTDVVIRDNGIEGPWSNGVSVADLFDADIGGNHITGPALDGFRIITGPLAVGGMVGPFAVGANLYHNNWVSGAGSAGFAVIAACGDVFRANHVTGNPLDVSFGPTTGSNIYLGNSATVSDQGAYDCDGDGRVDPNAITGPGLRAVNVKLGRVIDDLRDAAGVNVMR